MWKLGWYYLFDIKTLINLIHLEKKKNFLTIYTNQSLTQCFKQFRLKVVSKKPLCFLLLTISQKICYSVYMKSFQKSAVLRQSPGLKSLQHLVGAWLLARLAKSFLPLGKTVRCVITFTSRGVNITPTSFSTWALIEKKQTIFQEGKELDVHLKVIASGNFLYRLENGKLLKTGTVSPWLQLAENILWINLLIELGLFSSSSRCLQTNHGYYKFVHCLQLFEAFLWKPSSLNTSKSIRC